MSDTHTHRLRIGITSRHLVTAITMLLVISPFLSPRIGQSLTATDLLVVPAGVFALLWFPRIRQVIGDHMLLAGGAIIVYGLVLTLMLMRPLSVKPITVVMFQARILECYICYALTAVVTSMEPRAIERALLFGIYAIGLYAVYQLLTAHFSGYYGFIGLPGEDGPSQGGQLYAMSGLFFIYLANSRPHHQLRYLVVFIAYIGFAIGTISRSTMVGIGTTMLLFPLLVCIPDSRRMLSRNMRLMSLGLMTVPITIGALAFSDLKAFLALCYNVYTRLSYVSEGGGERLAHWTSFFHIQTNTSLLSYVTGLGVGSFQDLYGIKTLAFDSQYLRLIFELGIIGAVIWFWALFSVYRRIGTLNKSYLFFALVVSGPMLVMGFTHEIFYVGKTSATFYIMMGFFTGMAYRAQQENVSVYRLVEPTVSFWARFSHRLRARLGENGS